MITDQDVAEALNNLGTRETGQTWEYVVDDVRLEPGELDARMRLLSGSSVRIRLALPTSGRAQPWLFDQAVDACDWVHQLAIWLDEEIATGGFNWAAKLAADRGQYVAVERYGWRRSDPAEHDRLDEVWRQMAEPRHRMGLMERVQRLRAHRFAR